MSTFAGFISCKPVTYYVLIDQHYKKFGQFFFYVFFF